MAKDFVPLLLPATVGVVMAAVVAGYFLHWTIGWPVSIALIFGAIVCVTDPISVLAIFKALRVNRRLALIIEGESLLNDGTAIVLFQVLLGGIVAGRLGLPKGTGEFLLAVVGGAALGYALGYAAGRITKRIDDPQIEITLTTIPAYGSYLLAHHLHLSGVIATGAVGLMVGNFASKARMSERTRSAMQSFWEYVAFVMNSLVFLLIGLELRMGGLLRAARPVALAIVAVLLGRVLSVYALVPISNCFAEKIPLR